MGDPRLLQRADEIFAFDTPALHELVADMQDTMRHAKGAGLAAPQIGESLRLVIFGFEHNERYPEAPAVPPTVLVNPVLTVMGAEQEEGDVAAQAGRVRVEPELHREDAPLRPAREHERSLVHAGPRDQRRQWPSGPVARVAATRSSRSARRRTT